VAHRKLGTAPGFCLVALAASACQVSPRKADPEAPACAAAAAPLPNLALPTLGGKQFWADHLAYAGWRIQENVFSGHFRLLDPRDVRRAWGSREDCLAVFQETRRREGIRPGSRRAVVLVHGFLRSAGSMKRLGEALRGAGFEPLCVGYPSTQGTLAEHAARLEGVLDRLEDADEVSFVTHSLGGLVVREALARRGEWRRRLPVRALVMLAPPSRGAVMAEGLSRLPGSRWIAGPASLDLLPERAAAVPAPDCPFAIIAGGRGNGRGLNPFIPGDDDGLVGVEEARLEGAADFLLVRSGHTSIMDHPRVVEAAVSFLERGNFGE
jgi:hypothetical protein